MIPQRSLSALSNRLLQEQGGSRIPEAVLERDYCLSWFLVGLLDNPLGEKVAFKGGTALKKCYFAGYRFSEDLDFTLMGAVDWAEIQRQIGDIGDAVEAMSGVGISISRVDDVHQNSHTCYLAVTGPIARQAPQSVKIDFTISEHLHFPVERPRLLREYSEYNDLPSNVTVQAYGLQEIAAEKVLALVDRARNEPRDLYDIWYMIENAQIDLAALPEAMAAKLAHRGLAPTGLDSLLQAKEARLRALWQGRLRHQVATLPEFDVVYRTTRRHLRDAGVLEAVERLVKRTVTRGNPDLSV